MKVLVWTAPWACHGDPLFFKNCLRKHLIPQANLLANAGCGVDLVLPDLLASERALIAPSVRIIGISLEEQADWVGSLRDPSMSLYTGAEPALVTSLANGLAPKLGSDYQAILLWETPVPFLEQLFPNAVVIHQMPGAFSRPPYPHTVTFDPIGLYRHGALHTCAEQIMESPGLDNDAEIGASFSFEVRNAINSLQPYSRADLDATQRFRELILLPLQVSEHYAFSADTGYGNQLDFLLDVLHTQPNDVGVVCTQYVTPRVRDTVLTPETYAALKARWPNLIFKSEFDEIPSVSQFLLPIVDRVVTASSSLGLQAIAWARPMEVRGSTFLNPFCATQRNTKPAQNNRVLGFLLGRNQPLAHDVTENPKFLLSLIEEIVARKRAGHRGLDLLPRFHDIDEKYSERLLSSFMTDRAGRTLQKAKQVWSKRSVEGEKFQRLCRDKSVQVVTFDVFDTLIRRSTETPADVYRFLEFEAIRISEGIAADFARVRETSEVETRKRSPLGEITLDEIYATVQQHYGLNDAMTAEIKAAEVALEKKLIRPRTMGKKLWEIALASGKPIFLISDMYLPHEVVTSILDEAGYQGYRKLFLSCDYRLRKKEGLLYDVVLDELKVQPASVLHIGDNKIADTEQAQTRGIQAYRIPRAIERLRSNPFYKEIYSPSMGVGERARSAIVGLTAQALFDAPSGDAEKTSHFHGEPFRLGYAALGPMLTGYLLWLGRQARRDGISKLYFLSREGWLLKQIYDALHVNAADTSHTEYLYASRRATRVASLTGKGDVLALAGQPFKSGVTVAELLESRFGLATTDVSQATLEAAGYSSPGAVLESESEARVQFSALCASLADRILELAASERDAYMTYLRATGFTTEFKPAVVDIGWQANMQGALGALVGTPLSGYYYATLQGAETWKLKGHSVWAYGGDMLAKNHPGAVVSNRHLMEYLTCHVEPSLIRFELLDGVPTPVFRPDSNIGMRRVLVQQIHDGAIKFAQDFHDEYGGHADQIWIDPFLAERVFASFASNPSKLDASMLVGHYFEDALGGVRQEFVIHPDASRQAASVWKAGAKAVHAKVPSQAGTPSAAKPIRIRKPDHAKTVQVATPLHRRFESGVVRVIATPRKLAKYERDREAFFSDSRNPLLKAWYRWQP